MSAHTPRVSIGLPVYNGEAYLRPAIDSILRQDYADFELIISDNASTDATPAICREYAARDARIRYYRNEQNIGASGNYNRVFELACGEFFKWAAHDDVHLPGFLRRCFEVISQAPPTVALVAPKSEMIDERGATLAIFHAEPLDARNPQPCHRVEQVLQNINWATAQFGLFRTRVLSETGRIQPFFASDYVLLVEIALRGEIWELSETLFQRRVHPGISTTANKNWRELQAWFDPTQTGLKRFLPPTARLLFEIARAIGRSPLSLGQRCRCYWVVLRVWVPREFARLFRAWRNWFAFRTRLRKLTGGARASSH